MGKAGRKRIDDEVKAMIISLLRGGELTNAEIAEKCEVSERSVNNVKKEWLNCGDSQAIQESGVALSRYSKTELKYIKKIEAEQALFEDDEEGWVYHVTKKYVQQQSTSMWWSGIAYPESVNEDWIDRIRFHGLEFAISPLHDKDVWEHDSPEVIDNETGEVLRERGSRYQVGDRKKEHWHFIIKFPKKLGFRDVNDLIRPITMGPYLQKCYTLKGAYEYFIHLNHPNRYQYDKVEIQKYNNFVIEPTRVDQMLMLQDILETIRNEEIDSMLKLSLRYSSTPEYLFAIKASSYMITKVLDDVWRIHHPDHVKKIQIVK